MKFLIASLALCIATASAGTLRVELQHRFGDAPLALGSLRYEGAETYSVTRLSYLLSEFAVQKPDGSWIELGDQFAYLDAAKRRLGFALTDVPAGEYGGLRFSVGVPKQANHGDPGLLAAVHPLNPNLNQLHWDWATGYIFMAIEGSYRTGKDEINGFVFHLANDNQLSRIQLAVEFHVTNTTAVGLQLDLEQLLSNPRAISFVGDGASTHSHPGDPIASALVANLQSAFSVSRVSYPPDEIPRAAVEPLFLPEKFTPYPFKMSRRFPRPMLPRDNPLLEERVALGKRLFHDKQLSVDRSISCADCHLAEKAFTDGRRISPGVGGRLGDRNSMPLFNLAWKSSFFWDGRAKSLREQVLSPIQDHNEMAMELRELEERLNTDNSYREEFEKVFGAGGVTSEKVALALENFLLTLTSYDSKFDRAMAGKAELSLQEKRGMELFFTEYEPRSGKLGADCFHCHGGADFSDHQLHNNGLKPGEDLGRFRVTNEERDRLVFSTPSLRNVELTAPYMHDGRFETLEEVVAHYSGSMHKSPTLDPNLAKHPKAGLALSTKDKLALVAFLKSLTDPKYDSNPGKD